MNIIESIKIAVKTLTANKLRSSLTMLGIIIGNSSVIAMIGIGQGVQNYTLAQLESYGSNLLSVFAGGEDADNLISEEPTLVLSDAEAIFAQAPAVKKVAPQVSVRQTIVYRNRDTQVNIIGTTLEFLYVKNATVASGRFFNSSEQRQNALVITLGSVPAGKLFGNDNPVGKEVQINNISFQVIGVMKSKGSFGGVNQDDVVYVPISTMTTQIDGRQSAYGIPIDSIEVSAKYKQSISAAEFQISNLLTRRHGKKDFTVVANKSFQDLTNQVTGALTLMLAAIASISLLVGGIGIMNIMLVSVTERTQEIGLRKAIGATQQAILIQFLIEAMILSVAGGLIGTFIGIGSTIVVGILTPLKPSVSTTALTLAVGVSGSIGLIFGVVPARRAAQLDPIVALRSA